jgi:hypothetical protein
LPELVMQCTEWERIKNGLSNCFYFSPLMETLISPFTLRKAMIALFVNWTFFVCLRSVNKNTSHRE